jgi:hypothetical protein
LAAEYEVARTGKRTWPDVVANTARSEALKPAQTVAKHGGSRECLADKRWTPPVFLKKVDDFTGDPGFRLFDPVGILVDDNWVTFLSSSLTGWLRPQSPDKRTFIAPLVFFILLTAVCVTDGKRMVTDRAAQEVRMQAMKLEMEYVKATYHLEFDSVDNVYEAQTKDWTGFGIRIVLLIVIFPFTVLSNHSHIFWHWSLLKEHHKTISTAKKAGLLIALLNIVALIVGAAIRSSYPWYSLERLSSRDVSLPLCSGDREPVTVADPHALCSQSVSDWSLLQLAALPVLGEAWAKNLFSLVDRLACLTNISLMRNTSVGYDSTIVLAFDPHENKFAVAMPAMQDFRHDFGIFCENFLTGYYRTGIAQFVPFYSLVYSAFLGDVMTTLADILLSAILGPNRMSAYHLSIAQVVAGRELEIAWEVLEALGLSAERPVIVGHGANGLLAKALNISSDPWRISFEAPNLEGTPVAALANHASDEANRSRIFNFYGDGSFYSLFDESALVNNRIPDYGMSAWVPRNPFQTFCFSVAACASDDRFDAICNDILGKDRFAEIWKGLGRPRFA